MKTILTTDWAPYIERIVRVTAAVLVAVYAAGYCCGEWLHRLNDDITAMVVRRPAPAAPLQHPLMAIAADLEQLSSRELRAMTGMHRKARKAAMITAAVCVL
jgi:hypothetical protein